MVRTTPLSAFLVAVSALTLATADYQYEVTVINLTFMQPFSPVFLAAHTEEVQIFEVGTVSSDDLRALAETGDSSLIRQTLRDNPSELCGVAEGTAGLVPGASETITITVDSDRCPDGARFSMVSMLGNTNDAFFGIDSMELETEFSSTIHAPALDAGTEVNNELCTHVPGPACDETSGNQMGGPVEGFIHVHRGIRGNGDLSADDYAWINPVAKILISEPTEV